MGEAVIQSEQPRPQIQPPGKIVKAADYLVCRLFTDAVFNQDIRAIQLIINRIDGGLPKDCEMDEYQTQFADCLSELMDMRISEQLQVLPHDSVMMALCKSLYYIATRDIYTKKIFDKEGNFVKSVYCKPSTDKKNERDTAMRMILERTGGRRTTAHVQKEIEDIEEASWISQLSDKSIC